MGLITELPETLTEVDVIIVGGMHLFNENLSLS